MSPAYESGVTGAGVSKSLVGAVLALGLVIGMLSRLTDGVVILFGSPPPTVVGAPSASRPAGDA